MPLLSHTTSADAAARAHLPCLLYYDETGCVGSDVGRFHRQRTGQTQPYVKCSKDDSGFLCGTE